MSPEEMRAEIERLLNLNDRLSTQIINSSARVEASKRELLAIGWDAAVAAMTYEDGSKVEVAENSNPYRRPLEL